MHTFNEASVVVYLSNIMYHGTSPVFAICLREHKKTEKHTVWLCHVVTICAGENLEEETFLSSCLKYLASNFGFIALASLNEHFINKTLSSLTSKLVYLTLSLGESGELKG